ncbi:helix-turn-helix domain-containing protein [Dysgonomonas alginatilytica]|nr:helix-turn-helix transcriptional regulator [Dysgonomonas alginatilytica]
MSEQTEINFALTGDIVKEAREAAEMTQDELALYLGSSRQTVSTWENRDGEINIRPQLRKKLIDFITAGFCNRFQKTDVSEYKISAPYIKIDYYENYIQSLENGNRFFDFYLNEYPRGFYIAFQVNTKAMENNKKHSLSFLDIAIGKEVKMEEFNKEYEVYTIWIIVLSDKLIFTQLTDHNKKSNEIVCNYLNPSAKVSEQTLNLADVRKIFKVVQRVTTL